MKKYVITFYGSLIGIVLSIAGIIYFTIFNVSIIKDIFVGLLASLIILAVTSFWDYSIEQKRILKEIEWMVFELYQLVYKINPCPDLPDKINDYYYRKNKLKWENHKEFNEYIYEYDEDTKSEFESIENMSFYSSALTKKEIEQEEIVNENLKKSLKKNLENKIKEVRKKDPIAYTKQSEIKTQENTIKKNIDEYIKPYINFIDNAKYIKFSFLTDDLYFISPWNHKKLKSWFQLQVFYFFDILYRDIYNLVSTYRNKRVEGYSNCEIHYENEDKHKSRCLPKLCNLYKTMFFVRRWNLRGASTYNVASTYFKNKCCEIRDLKEINFKKIWHRKKEKETPYKLNKVTFKIFRGNVDDIEEQIHELLNHIIIGQIPMLFDSSGELQKNITLVFERVYHDESNKKHMFDFSVLAVDSNYRKSMEREAKKGRYKKFYGEGRTLDSSINNAREEFYKHQKEKNIEYVYSTDYEMVELPELSKDGRAHCYLYIDVKENEEGKK